MTKRRAKHVGRKAMKARKEIESISEYSREMSRRSPGKRESLDS